MTSNLPDHLPEDILIIDDTLNNLRALMSVLRQEGYTVRGASSGASALRMITADPPDLILLDIRMPVMDGYEVCRRLKADEKTAVIPVIFISAMGSLDDKMQGFSAGGVDYISKPFQVEEVLARVKTQLSLRQLQHHLETQNRQLQHEIAERHHAEDALQEANDVLEQRVTERTQALTLANARLLVEAAERERMQAALSRSELQYRTLFETLPVGVVVVGGDGRARTINSELSEILGYSLDEMQELDKNPGAHPMLKGMEVLHAKLIAEGVLHGYEMDFRTKDDRILSVRVNADTLVLEDETTLIVTIDDITSQKQMERERHESEEKFRTIVANTEAILFMMDKEGVVTLSEGKGLASLGLEPGQIVGMSAYEMYKDFPVITQAFDDTLTGKISQITVELNGIWFESWYSPYQDASGVIVGLIGMAVDITERKQAADALVDSQQKLEMVFASLMDAVFILDAGTAAIINVNPIASTMFGYEHEEMVGQTTVFLHINEDTLANFRSHLFPAIQEKGFLFLTDFKMKRKDGTVFPTEHSVSPVYNDAGELKYWVSVVRDITERHEQDKQVRQLSRAVEQSPSTIVITDLDGRIEYVNPQFSKTTGYTADEAMGQNPRLLKSDHTPSEEYATLWKTIKNGREWHGEFHNRKKNGELYWESASISPITDNDNVITHYLAVKEDITARKQMESALQRRNDELIFINRVSHTMISHLDVQQILGVLLEELRSFWNVSAGMIWMIEDASGDLVCSQITEPYQEEAINWRLPAGRSLLGWVLREKRGLIVDDAPQDPRFYAIQQNNFPIHSLLAVPLQSGPSTIGILQFVDEQVGRFTETNLKLMESLAATAVNTIENARLHQNLQAQLKKIKDTQAQLIQSEKLAAIGELISGIAHELNNPLASIILYAQLMEARGVDDTVRRDLDQIMTQSRRASNVVHGLLDFARQRPSERTSTQVNDVLKSTIDLLAYELRTHNIKVETNFSTAVPVILADRHQLQQVFVNLINNALQAMDSAGKGGSLTLTTKCSVSRLVEPANEKTILIIIQDDGPGIAQESASRVFDPFFTTKAEGKGTGLGLAVCHGIITDHQGDIWMESEQGRGAAFFIELPIIMLEEEVIADVVEKTAVSSIDAKDTPEKRILVVDDETSVLMVMTRILQRKGFVVDGAEDGVAALERLQQGSYDLIVSDLRMPGMSGQELYRQTIEKYPEYNGRFIFTTGDAINPELRTFLEEHNTPALEKPFEMEELIQVIEEWVTNAPYEVT